MPPFKNPYSVPIQESEYRFKSVLASLNFFLKKRPQTFSLEVSSGKSLRVLSVLPSQISTNPTRIIERHDKAKIHLAEALCNEINNCLRK